MKLYRRDYKILITFIVLITLSLIPILITFQQFNNNLPVYTNYKQTLLISVTVNL